MKPIITIDDFKKIELRVGKVVAAEVPEWSEKLIQETVDFGPEIGIKTVFSGMKAWYKPEDFIGKKFVFVVNLAERKMGESVSQGMLLAADGPDGIPTLIPVYDKVPEGTEVR